MSIGNMGQMKLSGDRRSAHGASSTPDYAASGLAALAFFTLALTALPPSPAYAETSPWFETTGGAVRLISTGAPQADGTYEAALEIRTDPGWKTYWRSPGDSGIGTSADFSGSDNVASAKLAFPAPERHEDPYSTTIGYEGGVVLPITVTPKKADAPVRLVGDTQLGLCKEVCVPVNAHLELALAPDRSPDSASAQAIEEAKARIPRPASAGDPLSVTGLTLEDGETPTFRITANLASQDAPADLFVEGPEGSYLTVPSLVSREGQQAIFSLSANGLVHDGDTANLRLTLVNGDQAAEQVWTVDTSSALAGE